MGAMLSAAPSSSARRSRAPSSPAFNGVPLAVCDGGGGRGPQAALYGRNAIGGAIIIRTQEPGDEFAGKVTLGYDSGPGFKVRGSVGGPINDSKTLKYMRSEERRVG